MHIEAWGGGGGGGGSPSASKRFDLHLENIGDRDKILSKLLNPEILCLLHLWEMSYD